MFSKFLMPVMAILMGLQSQMAQAFAARNFVQVQNVNGKIILEIDPRVNPNKLDILFVVDDSGSMADHQRDLIQGIDELTKKLIDLKINTNAAVITTSVKDNYSPILPGHFVGGKFFNSNESEFLPNLKKMLQVGTNGSAQEQPLAALNLALTEPLLSNENKGFIRPDAILQVVILTDAEDQSPLDVNQLATYLKTFKNNKVSVTSAMVPLVNPDPSCHRDDDSQLPVQLEQFTKMMDGQIVSICAADFAKNIAVYNPIFFEFDRNILLPTKPKFETIKVQFGQANLVAGDLMNGWVYDSTANKIGIGSKYDFLSQPVGSKLRIEYVPFDWEN